MVEYLLDMEKTKVRFFPCLPRYPDFHYDWTGKNHSDETKRKIGEANKKMVGKLNSQYGKTWLYHESLKKSIVVEKEKIEDYLLDGWKKGRKIKFD